MTNFDSSSTEVNPEFHSRLSPAQAKELMLSFYRKVPAPNLGTSAPLPPTAILLSQVTRLEAVVSLLVGGQIAFAVEHGALMDKINDIVIRINEMQDSEDAERKAMADVFDSLRKLVQNYEGRFNAVANSLTILGAAVFGAPSGTPNDMLQKVLDTLNAEEVEEPDEAPADVPASVTPVTVRNPETGQPLTLTFPGGDPFIVDEQGLFGFYLPPAEDAKTGNITDYLSEVVISLFERDLVSDELSDTFLRIMSDFDSGDAPTDADLHAVGEDFPEDMQEALDAWWAGDGDGYFIAEWAKYETEPVLLGALTNVFLKARGAQVIHRAFKEAVGL